MSCSLDRRFASLLVFSDSGVAFDYFSVPVAIGAAIKQANWFEMQEITFLLKYVGFVEPNKCKQLRFWFVLFLSRNRPASRLCFLMFCNCSKWKALLMHAHTHSPMHAHTHMQAHHPLAAPIIPADQMHMLNPASTRLPLLTFNVCIYWLWAGRITHTVVWGGRLRVGGMPSFGHPTNVPAADGVEVFKARLHLFGGALLPTVPPTLSAALFHPPQPLCRLHSFHGYVWNRHSYRPVFFLYIFTVLHSDSSAASALPLSFCVLQHVVLVVTRLLRPDRLLSLLLNIETSAKCLF